MHVGIVGLKGSQAALRTAKESIMVEEVIKSRESHKAEPRQLSAKAQITRASLVAAAAELLQSAGPEAVTYRHVAERAGASSSSVGYYFDSINDLQYEAASYNIRLWCQRAERAAHDAEQLGHREAREEAVRLLLQACLPAEVVVPVSHYAQLIAAAESDAVTEAYRMGRRRLNLAVERILVQAGLDMSPGIVVAIVDGAAVGGISEGYPVRQMAQDLLEQAISQFERVHTASE